VHLVIIFGFLVSPAGKEVALANRSVTVLLTPAPDAPKEALAHAPAHQHGRSKPLDSDSQMPAILPTKRRSLAINEDMQSTGSAASGAVFSQQRSALVAAHEALEAEYVRRWQIEIEQFGNSAYADTAKRFGNGDVRLRVKVDLDGNLQDIQVLSTSGIAALDRAAIETVERLAPFDAFPTALANSVAELDIIRTWQFRY
jgi:TonB family protein